MGTDAELNGPRIIAALRSAHAHHLSVFCRGGRTFYAVLAFLEDDAFTASLTTPGELAQRTATQRHNLILAVGTEINETLWRARNRPLPDEGHRLTLWFERATARYYVLPYCRRTGAVGRPVLIRPAHEEEYDPSALILPPAA